MKNSENRAHYNMSYAALMQLGDKANILIERDSEELAAFGINEETKEHIKQKTTLLKNIPTDEELIAKVSICTGAKNKLADELRNKIRAVTLRAKIIFGTGSYQYKHFGVEN